MKGRLLLAVILVFGMQTSCFSQMKVEKYCMITSANQNYARKNVSIKLNYGLQDSLMSFKDSAVLYSLRKVEEQHTLLDAFNYMASIGWVYVQQIQGAWNTYLFKRTFDISELK